MIESTEAASTLGTEAVASAVKVTMDCRPSSHIASFGNHEFKQGELGFLADLGDTSMQHIKDYHM